MFTEARTAFLGALFVAVVASRGQTTDTICELGPIDLVFVMDESGSIQEKNFLDGLSACANLTNALEIGSDTYHSRVGFVLFDSSGHLMFHLDAYSTNGDVANAIRALTYSAGDTNITSGMEAATIEFLSRGRNSIPKVMVIVTDGSDTSNVGAAQTRAAAFGIAIYALGVGSDIDTTELIKATGDPSHVFNVSDYQHLGDVFNLFCHGIQSSFPPITAPTFSPAGGQPADCGCVQENWSKVWLDLVFVLDASDDISIQNYDTVKEAISRLADYYTIGTGKPGSPNIYTRVALINVNNAATVIANLTTCKNSSQLKDTVSTGLKRVGGAFNSEAGLRAANDLIQNDTLRPNVRKVVIVLTGTDIDCSKQNLAASKTKADENHQECQLASTMKNNGVVLMTIADSLDGISYPIVNIADPCYQMLGYQSKRFFVNLCQANCYCLFPTTQFISNDTCTTYGECVYPSGQMDMDYDAAESSCAMAKQTLSDVMSREKQHFLRDMLVPLNRFPFWIGGKLDGNAIRWETGRVTSATGQNGDFVDWAAGEPDPSKHCIYATNTSSGSEFLWKTDTCGIVMPSHFFACQLPACSVNRYCEFLK